MTRIIKVLLAGIAIGVLVAPAKGSKTRKRIARCSSEFGEHVHDYISDLREILKPSAPAELETEHEMI